MSDALESLLVKIEADLDGLKAGMTQANGLLDEFAEHGGTSAKKVAEGFIIAELAVEALRKATELLKEATVDLVREQLVQIDHLAKLSDRTGIATEKLVGLGIAAEENGLQLDSLVGAIQKMERGLQEAADKGTGPAADGLDRLGLSARDLIAMKPDEAFAKVADSLMQVGSQSERTKIAVDLFGRSGIELVGILSKGSAGLEEAQAKAEKFGLAISRVDARQVERANIAMQDIHLAIEGAARTLTVKLAPYLEIASNWIVDMTNDAGGFEKAMLGAVDNISSAIGVMADMVQVLRIGWAGVVVAVTGLGDAIYTVAEAIVHTVRYANESIGNFVTAVGHTAEAIKDEFVYAFDWAAATVASFVKTAILDFGNMVLYLSRGMTALGVKSAKDVMEAGFAIRNSVMTFGDESERAAKRAETAMTASAHATENAWKNVLPNWDDIDTGKIGKVAEAASMAFAKAKADLDAVWNQPMPSAGITASIDRAIEAVKHATKVYQEELDKRRDMDKADHDNKVKEAADDLKQYEQFTNAKRIAENKDFLEREKRAKQEFDTLGTEQAQRDAILEEMKREHEVRLANIQDTYAQQQQQRVEAAAKFENSTNLQKAEFAASVLGNLATLMNTHSKRMFEVGKVAAIGEAIINTAVAVTKAYNQFGYPYGLIAGAAMAVAGGVQIAKIASTSFNSGGSVGAVSGGGSAPSGSSLGGTSASAPSSAGPGVTGQGGPKQNADIVLQGNFHDTNAVRDLVQKIKDVLDDGGNIGRIVVSQ